MNYDETAKKILSDWDNYCFKLLDGDTPAFDIQEAIAAALADAENRAAWRGFFAGGNYFANYSDPILQMEIEKNMNDEYGPRPTDAAKEVGNE